MKITEAQIAELRELYEKHAEILKWAESQAAKDRAASPPQQTTGEKIAASVIRSRCPGMTAVYPPRGPASYINWPADTDWETVEGILRRALAEAIDHAIAEEREACAKVADTFRGLHDGAANAARMIRARGR